MGSKGTLDGSAADQAGKAASAVHHNQPANAFQLLRRPMVIVACAALVPPFYVAGSARPTQAAAIKGDGGGDRPPAKPGRAAPIVASPSPRPPHAAPWHGVILGLASSDAGQRTASLASLRKRLAAAFERDDIRARLEAYAIRVEDARARIAALTDRQVAAVIAALDIRPENWGTRLPRARVEIFAQTLSSVLRLPFAVLVAIICEPFERRSRSVKG